MMLLRVQGGGASKRKKTDIEALRRWKQTTSPENNALRVDSSSTIGMIKPVRWDYRDSSSDSVLQLNENLCTVTLFRNTSEYVANELSSTGLLQHILQIPEKRAILKNSNRYTQRISSGSFYGDKRNAWIAFGIPQLNQYSDITFVLPRNESTHEQVLRLLGDAGIDILLKCLGARYQKNMLDVTQAFFYVVKNCWSSYKHVDFRKAGSNRFNVLIPILLSGEGKHELILWDQKDLFQGGKDGNELSGRYQFRIDEGLIIGEEVHHSTCVSDEMRLMMCLCIQQLPEKKTGSEWKDFTWVHKEAFPNSVKHWGYLKHNRGRHYLKGDPRRGLHQQVYEREIYSIN